MIYKVGDRVTCIGQFAGYAELDGISGKVVHIVSASEVGVEFENWQRGHNCNGHAKERTGRYGYEDELRREDENARDFNLRHLRI